ncbi:MAG: DNA polymerase IV [Lentisphaerae bacterium]|nr:DNA polymerase IV [Lentisphaerota bacterium]
MPTVPITLAAYPKAIIHLDADAFFASVEQALVPALRGKPLATGKERGIIACANYAAKAAGVKRGVPLHMARELCPTLIVVPSDYEAYSLFSTRMFNIMRTFTPIVEEYSIDEAFADITGMRRVFRTSYEEIARRMKDTIQRELGITVSVGLSTSKSLAKLCSKFRKPDGFTAVQGRHIHLLLERTPLERVWGFGPNTVSLLKKHGLTCALDYINRPETWAAKLLHKPGREIWNELRGHAVWEVNPEEKSAYATILKSKTFSPSSRDRELVFAKLIRNVEAAFQKARRYHLRPRGLAVILRHQDFHHDGLEAKLNRPTASTLEVLPLIRHLFEQVFRAGAEYRATMIILGNLQRDDAEQLELFEDRLHLDQLRQVTIAVDAINARFGQHTVGSGTALNLDRKPAHARDEAPLRHGHLLRGETAQQRLGIPRLDIKV